MQKHFLKPRALKGGNRQGNQDLDQRQAVLKNRDLIEDRLNRLLGLDPELFALSQMKHDPIYNKIKPQDRAEIITESLKSGRAEAEGLRRETRSSDPFVILDRLKLDLFIQPREQSMDYIYFGLFTPPNEIHLFESNLKRAADCLAELALRTPAGGDISSLISFDLMRKIVVAHEIFHYIEEIKPELYSNTKEIDLWSLGSLYTHRSKLICASEIAGMSFAQNLLCLPFNPNVLDYIFLLACSFTESERYYRRIAALLADH